VSSGSIGFWFCNWVVSRVRNVWKLPASVALLVELVVVVELDDDVGFGFAAAETGTVGSPTSAAIVLLLKL
jgi:hypothetical protein